MITERFEPTIENIEKAGAIIRRGGLVAFPTETVYGLGANALDATAVRSIYQAKGRPSDNPIIVHIGETKQLGELVSEIPQDALVLMGAFWPGPITFVFKKSEIIPYETTGGLDTVAIRMPSNKTARDVINAARRPIAAPSANISGRPSPTKATDVLEDMDGRIDAIIMGEDCKYGIESTVIDLTASKPVILRPGAVTKSMIEKEVGHTVRYDESLLNGPSEDIVPRSPGMKYKHYAPRARVRIIVGNDDTAALSKINELRLEAETSGLKVAVLDYGNDSKTAAKEFFASLRDCDRQGIDIILVYANDDDDLGFSVMNRMIRSAGYDVLRVD